MAPRLGAPEGGVLEGPSLPKFLETVLKARPAGRVFLTPSLLPQWGHRIEDRGGRPVPLEDEAPHGRGAFRGILASAGPGDQVWLDLGDPWPPGADPDAVDAFLALAAGLPEPPLVVLLRDDAPARPRTQRLAVDRPGRVLLLRETAQARAYALGRPPLVGELAAAAGWTPLAGPFQPLAGPAGGRLLALDVDGVLIDPGRACMEAVAGALAELAPGLPWSDGHYLRFKRAGGFNNDFRLTAAALALAERGEDPGPGALAGGGLEPRIEELEPGCRSVFRRHHARTGHLARALATRPELEAFPGGVALCTRRPPAELQAAFEVLGFQLPAVGDSAPHLRKPRPEGLIQLADRFRAASITFVGDSVDDAEALRCARALRPELGWRFAAVGPGRGRILAEGDLQGATVQEILAQLADREAP